MRSQSALNAVRLYQRADKFGLAREVLREVVADSSLKELMRRAIAFGGIGSGFCW